MRAQVPFVELHALDQIDGRFEGLALGDGNHAVFADLVHRLRQPLADLEVLVRGADGHLLDLLAGLDRGAHVLELCHDRLDRHVDALLDLHRVGAGGDILEPLLENALGQDRRGRGAVAGHGRGLRRDFLDHLGPHVLIGVFQLDFLGDAHAVLGHGRRAERLFQDDDLAGGPQRHFDGLGELLHAVTDGRPCLSSKSYLFRCHVLLTP